MKKKAIKIATASVVAASSFAAVAPFSTEAASSVPSTVAKAVKSMKAAKTAYKSLGDKGKVASVASVQKAVNQAKADYSKAKAALAKYKGKDKSKLNKQLMAAMKDYHNATDYIKAVNYASGLKKQADSFAAAAKAGKSINASDYAKFKAELAKATKKVMDQIVGLADKAVVKAYITPALAAQKTVDSYLVSVKSVDEVAAVTVDEGSKLEDVKLPKEVTVTLVNGKKAQKAVTWDTKELETNLSKPGDYTVKGAVADTKLEASVKVTVNAVNPKVESVSAINAKTLEVKFNKAVDFKAEDFSVSKGTVKSNIANVTIAEDKKSAQIELTSKFTKGDYTVSVKQDGKDPLTATTSVEDEKVAGVQILSDNAVYTQNGSKATVGIKVTNQYGEDVTKLNVSGLTVTVTGAATGSQSDLSTDGTLTLTPVSSAKEGDKVTITVVHGATATTTTKTVTLSAKAVPSTVEVGTLYNKDGKTLSQDTDLAKDKFYLPITVKDQYGNEITDASKVTSDKLIVTNTNPSVVTFANQNEIKEITINGKQVLALEVSNVGLAGTATVLVIPTSNGKSAQGTVTVNDGVKIGSVSLLAPAELVTANKDVYFPLTVIDSKGNEVKTLKALNAIKDPLTPSVGEITEVDGKDGLFVKVTNGTGAGQVAVTEGTPITIVVTSKSGKVATQTVTPKAEAVPTVITGLSSKVATALRTGDTAGKTIKNTDLVVEDQFGQVITDNTVLSGLQFEVSAPDSATFTVTNGTGANLNKQWTIKPANGATKTSEKLTFKLIRSGSAVEASAFTKAFSIVADADFASYKVEDIDPIYVVDDTTTSATDDYKVATGYDQEVVVKATSKNGAVVTLTEGADYSVTGYPQSGITFAKDADTTTKTITVTINATGEQFTKQVTYSKVAPKAAKVQVVEDASADPLKDVSKLKIAGAAAFDLTALETAKPVVVTDQYGIQHTLSAGSGTFQNDNATVTFTKVSGNVTFASNGTKDAAVTAAEAGAVVNAKVTVGDQSVTVQVTFTNGVDTIAPSVDPAKFTVDTDAATGSPDKIKGAAGAVSEAGATVKGYIWTDSNSNGVVDAGELGSVIDLGTSGVGGTVAAANIGNLAAGTYKIVITATDAAGNTSAKTAAAAATITLAN